MITAIDSCVLLDVLINDPTHCRQSQQALEQASRQGRLIVGDQVVAEICPSCAGDPAGFLHAVSIDFVPNTLSSALSAGEYFRQYLANGGKRGRAIADFLVGTHALEHADRLLTRDKGFQRQYFSDLSVWYG